MGRRCGESSTSKRRIEAVERQFRCLELRKAGHSYRAIAEQVGLTTQGAHLAVESALKRTLQESSDQVRKLEAERLDALLLRAFAQATEGGGSLAASATVLSIMARRAKMLGYDAPSVSLGAMNVDGTPMTPEQTAAKLRAMSAAMFTAPSGTGGEPSDSGEESSGAGEPSDGDGA